MGFLSQHMASSGGTPAAGGQLASHGKAIPAYLTAIFLDWALLYYCWKGVRRHGGTLATLSGGRWTSWKSVATDIAIALPFWAILEGADAAVHKLLGPSSAKSIDSLLPETAVEIILWVLVSVTAGICEELVFRGYLQRQLHALAGHVAVAVLAQGLIFGIGHSYQGWKSVTAISVIGVLFGVLAVWRRNLRANIVAHAWTDIWSGWLQAVLWR
jgi:membrane protease YdiL (CAAX protease family)